MTIICKVWRSSTADIVKDYRNRVKPCTEDTCHAELPQHTLTSMGCYTLRSQYKQGREFFWQSHWFCKAFNEIKIQMTHIHYCPCQLFQQRKACFCWHFLQIVLNFCSSSSSIKRKTPQPSSWAMGVSSLSKHVSRSPPFLAFPWGTILSPVWEYDFLSLTPFLSSLHLCIVWKF
jgi:hypothetical protein